MDNRYLDAAGAGEELDLSELELFLSEPDEAVEASDFFSDLSDFSDEELDASPFAELEALLALDAASRLSVR